MLWKLSLTLGSLLIVLSATLLADWLLGRIVPVERALVFEPNTAARYRAAEFDVIAHIGALGFRESPDAAFDLSDRGGLRVLVLGDSFTFGWGVADDEAWPAVLEANLRQRGLSAAVLNLGKPGAGPREYLEIAEQAIPLLEPDLVVVGVLQAEDLLQLRFPTPREAADAGAGARAFRSLRRVYPNAFRLRNRALADASRETIVTAGWARQALGLILKASLVERSRLQAIDPVARGMFRSGSLNPGLLLWALRRPDAIASSLELDEPAVRHAIDRLSAALAGIDAEARAVGAETLALSVPYGALVSPHVLANARRMGLEFPANALETKAMDEALQRAARRAGVESAEVTDAMRSATRDKAMFFAFDGHLNAAGHRFLATQVEIPLAPRLEAKIEVRGLPKAATR